MAHVLKWLAMVAATLVAAFGTAILTWWYGLPVVHTGAGSSDRIVLAVGVATVVGAVVALPLASWAAKEKLRPPQPGSDGGMSLANASGVGVAAGERSQEASFKAYLRQMEYRLVELGMNQSSFVPLTMVQGPAVNKAAAPDFLPDLEWMSRRADQRYISAEPEKISLLDIPDRFDQTVMLGEPGSGKTTCLQRLAQEVLERAAAWLKNEEANFPGLHSFPKLPLYASLSQWQQGTRALEFLRTQLQNLLGPENYYVIHFETLLADGCFILMLDGLNELPGRRPNPSEGRHEQREEPDRASRKPEMRVASIDRREIELRELASSIGLQSKFILTCRSHEYFDSHRWQTVRILPMNPEQISRFIYSYLDAQRAAGLQISLGNDNKLAMIANNPFFLRVIIAIYQPGLQLTNRGQILSYLYKTLLQRERARYAEVPPEPVITSIIGRASYEMLASGKIGSNATVDVHDNSRRACLRIVAGTGLVVERGGSFFFLHQIIQEFFAAMALDARVVRRSPKTLLADKRWSEVVALWCDVDSDRMPDRLIAALRARNLPWRRPRSSYTPLLSVYQLLIWLSMIAIVASYFWNWVFGPPRLLSFPVRTFSLAPLAFVMLAVAIRLLWSFAIRHHKIVVNGAYVLTQIRYYRALENIVSSLSKLYYTEAAEVAGYVGQTFGLMALPQVTHGLEHRKWRVRMGCVLILGEIARSCPDDRRALEYLLAVAGAGDPQLMKALVEALGGCRDDRIPGAVGQLLSSPRTSPFTLQARLSPLSKWGSGDDATWNDETLAAFDELVKESRPPFIRGGAFQAMGVLRVPDCETRLGTVAADSDEEKLVRQGAIKGLGMAQTPLAVERLAQIAEQRPEVRKWACTALRQIRDPGAVPALSRTAESSQWEVRQSAAVALGATGRPETFDTLELLADDDDSDVREAAARALSLIDLPAAVPVLGRLARDRHTQVRRAALEALNSRYPHLASQELLMLAEDSAHPDRVRIIRSLGRHAHPGTEEKLNSLLASPEKDVRDAAAEALRGLRASAGKRKRATGRSNILGAARGRLATWLQFDGYQQLYKEEQMSGVTGYTAGFAVSNRIMTDAELTRQYRPLLRLIAMLTLAFIIFGSFIIMLAFRFSLWSATGMLDEWPYFAGLLVFAVVSFLPGIRYFSKTSLVGLLRALAFAVIAIGMIGGILYVWWVVAAAVAIAGLLIFTIGSRRRRRRRRDVCGALRSADAALTPA